MQSLSYSMSFVVPALRVFSGGRDLRFSLVRSVNCPYAVGIVPYYSEPSMCRSSISSIFDRDLEMKKSWILLPLGLKKTQGLPLD